MMSAAIAAEYQRRIDAVTRQIAAAAARDDQVRVERLEALVGALSNALATGVPLHRDQRQPLSRAAKRAIRRKDRELTTRVQANGQRSITSTIHQETRDHEG